MAVKKLQCPNCGAKLKKNQEHCEYCGTVFQTTEPQIQQENTKIEDDFVTYNREIVNTINTGIKSVGKVMGIAASIYMVIFGFFFTAIAIFISVTAFSSGLGIIGIFLLIFVFVGIFVVITGIKNCIKAIRNNKNKNGD